MAVFFVRKFLGGLSWEQDPQESRLSSSDVPEVKECLTWFTFRQASKEQGIVFKDSFVSFPS